MATVKPGLEVLIEQQLDLLKGKRVGLITNHSAITSDATHILDALLKEGVNVTALFGPEHGVRGDVADGEQVASAKDPRTGIPMHSLYGGIDRPTAEMLADVDVLINDLQDVGARFYTFTYTMTYCMQAAAEHGKQFIVLDRPNPINGVTVDGMVLEPDCASGIGRYAIPDRHGMTIGELALLFNDTIGFGADLHVVLCQGWTRDMWWDETGLHWPMPSPNIPTVDSALAFPITCMIEGTQCSEGRGMCRPFETVGAPWIDAYALAEYLNALDLPGVRFRAAHFIPRLSKHQGVACNGVQIHFTDRDAVQCVRTGLHVVQAIHDLYPDKFEFRPENDAGNTHFELVTGTKLTRKAINAGTPADDIYASYQPSRDEFMKLREKYLLY